MPDIAAPPPACCPECKRPLGTGHKMDCSRSGTDREALRAEGDR